MAMLIRQLSKADRGCQSTAPLSLHRITCDVGYLVPLPFQVPQWLVRIVQSIQDAHTRGARLAETLAGQHTSGFVEQRLHAPVSVMFEAPNSQ